MKKTTFLHVGDIARGPDAMFQAGTLILADKCRFDALRFPFQRERTLVAPGQLARQVKDDNLVPFAVAVDMPVTSDCFFPVFLEVEDTAEGQRRVISLRVNLHPNPKERRNAPGTRRLHRKK